MFLPCVPPFSYLTLTFTAAAKMLLSDHLLLLKGHLPRWFYNMATTIQFILHFIPMPQQFHQVSNSALKHWSL